MNRSSIQNKMLHEINYGEKNMVFPFLPTIFNILSQLEDGNTREQPEVLRTEYLSSEDAVAAQ